MSGAVFLSYASQDTDAARRIAEALKAAGVEVWFDQSELVGGDAWDAKIRKQISECALFVPVISANTQARLEGYFRLEWKLAAQRTYTMADEKVFLLPVLIDDTRDVEAKVPAEFKAVQWTRLVLSQSNGLPGSGNAESFGRRVRALLDPATEEAGSEHRTSTIAQARPAETGLRRARPRGRRAGRLVLVTAGLVLLLAAAGWWRIRVGRTPLPSEANPATAATPMSNSAQIVAQAWKQLNRADLARAELAIADELCRRATELDATNADAWAAWSFVDSWYCYHSFDNTAERREGARSKAARALQLSPTSFEARLAQANYLVREGSDAAVSLFAPEADRLLRGLLQEQPKEPRALLTFAILQRNLGHSAEARQALETMATVPAAAPLAWHELAWVELRNGKPNVALELENRSIALVPAWHNLTGKMMLLLDWQGDLDAARAVLEQIPAAAMQEDYTVTIAMRVLYTRREPVALLRLAGTIPRSWLQSNMFSGPLEWWEGLAEEQAGHVTSARVHWLTAMKLVESRLVAAPSSAALIAWKGRLLAKLGDVAEGEKALRLAWEMHPSAFYLQDRWLDQISVGETEQVLEEMEGAFNTAGASLWAASLRLFPGFDSVRDLPRFQSIQARLAADPRYDPRAAASSRSDVSDAAKSPPANVDSKSVAVLAFANLSDDKSNEYFSDGISEELLNVLAKIPGLKVTARTSAFYFKGKDAPIPEIAQKLGVAYVVEGSVRKAGDKVRITAQLIKAADGFHVWSDTFTRDLKDVFAVQDEIAGLVAQTLELKIGAPEPSRREVNPEVHRLVLEARHFWNRRTMEGFARAEAAARQAIALDPDFATAHAMLAIVLTTRSIYRGYEGVSDDSIPAARQSAERAIALDAGSVEAQAALGIAAFVDGRFDEADRIFQRAIALNPSVALPHHWYSLVLESTGRLDDALREIDRAIELDPLSGIAVSTRGRYLAAAGRAQEALAAFARAAPLLPDRPTLHGIPACCLLQLGRREEAVTEARKIAALAVKELRLANDADAIWILRQTGHETEAGEFANRILPQFTPESYQRGAVLVALGRWDEAEPFLAKTPREMRYMYFWSPIWDAWRDDPRFIRLLNTVGCAAEYRVARETLSRMRRDVAPK